MCQDISASSDLGLVLILTACLWGNFTVSEASNYTESTQMPTSLYQPTHTLSLCEVFLVL